MEGNKINLCTVHFNTPMLMDALLKSIEMHVPNFHLYIFDSSDKEPYHTDNANVTIIDNTKGQIINFTKWLERYPDRKKSFGYVNGHVSAKHCYSIQKCMEIIDDNFILLDSDILLKQDITPLFDEDYLYVGQSQKQNGVPIIRVLPFLCFINVKKCKEYGITYFSDEYMHGLHPKNDHDWYDTGAYFYKSTRDYNYQEINLDDYIVHYKGGSWSEREQLTHGKKMSSTEWLNDNYKYWNLTKDGLSVIVCATNEDMVNNLKQSLDKHCSYEHEYLIYYNNDKKSISQVYNFLARKSKYNTLLFIHQDVQFLNGSIDPIIYKLLNDKKCGYIGFAGSKVKPKTYSGWNIGKKYQSVNYYQTDINKHNYIYNDKPFEKVVDIDGLALFTSREHYLKNQLDETLIDGFHCYDLFLTINAFVNGYNNYVYTADDFKILHLSGGIHDINWYTTTKLLTDKVLSKYGFLKTNDILISHKEENEIEKNSLTKLQKEIEHIANIELKQYLQNLFSKNKKVLYTCITGNYDNLPLVKPQAGWDYVCFTDQQLTSNIWEIRQIPYDVSMLSTVKKQRYIKINPHLFLSDYDISVWIDANLTPQNDLDEFVSKQNISDEKPIAFKIHPGRNCVYDEIEACVHWKRETQENADKIKSFYKSCDYPRHNGMYETNVIVRRHNDPKCIALMEKWTLELLRMSHRDQLSLNYCIWRLNCSDIINEFEYMEANKYFMWNPHNNGGNTNPELTERLKNIDKPTFKQHNAINPIQNVQYTQQPPIHIMKRKLTTASQNDLRRHKIKRW